MFDIRPRTGSIAFVLVALVGLAGCDDSGAGAGVAPPPTQIVVDPEQFDSSIACLAEPGALRVYVATLFDVSAGYSGAVPGLPSSPPTACTQAVSFGYVEPGRKYRAEIDAYDRTDIEPLTAGNRLLQRTGSAGEIVPPRWQAACGNVLPSNDAGGPDAAADGGVDLSFLNGPAEAFLNTPVTVRGCTSFIEVTPNPGVTALRLDLQTALGSLECGAGIGQVYSYEANVRGDSSSTQRARCAEPLTFSNLEPEQTHFIDVAAFAPPSSLPDAAVLDGSAPAAVNDASLNDSGSSDASASDASAGPAVTPSWRTTCYQRAVAGVTRSLVCDPLRPSP